MHASNENGEGKVQSKDRIHWEPLVAAGALVFTILGVVVPLFVHLDNKTEARLTRNDQEMRDFHEKLIKIEERRLNKSP